LPGSLWKVWINENQSVQTDETTNAQNPDRKIKAQKRQERSHFVQNIPVERASNFASSSLILAASSGEEEMRRIAQNMKKKQ
jgi:hypothetical protein